MSPKGITARLKELCRSRILGSKYWLLKYKWKENLSGDLVAGATMAIIQIPQGMINLKHIFLNIV